MNTLFLRMLVGSALLTTFNFIHAATLVPLNAVWRYSDTGGDLGTAWRSPTFDDSAWASGPAELGFGDSDEATVIGAFGARPPSVYFRTHFITPHLLASSNLNVRLIFDDGAIAYLNGVEVLRANMPSGPVTWSTLASSAAENNVAEAIIPATLLNDGDNVLAVEVHQVMVSSSDLSFALELNTSTEPPEERTRLSVGVLDGTASESGASGAIDPARFVINRTGNLATGIPVMFALGGTASNGVDYIAITNVFVPAGATQTVVMVHARHDLVTEGSETVVLTIIPPVCPAIAPTPPECYVVDTPDSATVQILDSGSGRTVLRLTVSDPDAAEPGLSTLLNTGMFKILRSGNLETGIPVQFTLQGTAQNGVDFISISNSIFIAPGATQALVHVVPLFDNLTEGTESVVMSLVPPACVAMEPVPPTCYLIEGTNLVAVLIRDFPSEPTNRPPTVAIVAPAHNSVHPAPANIEIVANANDPDGYMTILGVEFYAGTNLLAFRTNLPVLNPLGPFVVYWTNVPAGIYTLTAVAIDAAGARGTSAPVRVTVGDGGDVPLVAMNAVWRYSATGTDLGTAWSSPGYDDSSWPAGPAELGYGDFDEATVIGGEIRPQTAYFRTLFTVNEVLQSPDLHLRLKYDDGAVVYLNGTEVFRVNMPVGPITYGTLALNVAENNVVEATIPASLLNAGGVENLLAVEIHQVNVTSSDLSFALELRAQTTPPPEQTRVSLAVIDSEAAEPGVTAAVNPATFAIRRTGNLDHAIPVPFTLSGTASNGLDYHFISNSVVIPAGSTQVLIQVVALMDNLVEPRESVTLTIPRVQCIDWDPICYELPGGVANVNGTVFINDATGGSNHPPNVEIVAPANGTVYPAPASIFIVANAGDEDGYDTIIGVQFFANTTSLGFRTNLPVMNPMGPFFINWTNVPAGVYDLRAVAIDSSGARGTSAPVRVTVVADDTRTLVAANAVWRYSDTAVDLGTEWQAPIYDDSSWPAGPAELGYGDGDEATVIGGGLRPPTVYFRTHFTVADPLAVESLGLRIKYDDGAVVYLNGVEAFRVNMPEGPVTFSTLASTVAENNVVEAAIPTSLLNSGDNVIAVEVHQVAVASSDLGFSLELRAGGIPPIEDTIVSVAVIDGTAVEGGPTAVINPATFALRRTGNLGTAIPVHFTLSGTASNGVDYRYITNTAVIPANSTQFLVHVVAMLDEITEGPETAVLEITQINCLVPSPECYTVGVPNRGTVTILDGFGTNRAPIVQLVAPPNGTSYPAGTNIMLVAAATDTDGTVRRVDFTANNSLVGFTTNGIGTNYFLLWSNAPAGAHNLRAIALDDRGGRGTSAPVSVTVIGPPPPTNSAAELHVVAIYSGLVNGTSSANHETGDALVRVDRPGSHVILVLSAYEPTRWHVEVMPDTIIDSVLLLGYYDQSVDGLLAGTPVIEQTAESGSSHYFYISPSIDTPQFLRNVQQLCRTFGRGISSYHGSYVAHGTDYPTPIQVDSIQNDPRLSCGYPQPVDAPELPDLHFTMAFNDGSSSAVLVQEYGKGGPLFASAKLLPTHRVVRDVSGDYFGAEQHHIWKVDMQAQTVQDLHIPSGLPELSWPMGVAYDSTRDRIAVVTLGGEGHLYGYDPIPEQWSLISSMENRDVDSLVYHAADDSFYGVTVGFGDYSSPRLLHFSASGAFLGEMSLPQQPYGIGFSGFRSELVSVGNYLAWLLETDHYVPDGGKPESRIYIIDPVAQQTWLTYRRIGETANRQPTVRITSPTEGATLPLNGATRLTAEASDPDGVVQSVQFYANGSAIGFGQRLNMSASVFVLDWTPPATGPHTLKALATDGLGAQAWSIPVAVGAGTNIPPATNLTFRLAFNDRNGPAGVFFRNYTLEGPLDGARLLPTTRVVPDASEQWFYGAESHEVWKVNRLTGAVTFIHDQIPAELPEFSWPIGAAYDNTRHRVLVATLGGEGDLYAYTPQNGPWAHVSGLANHDYDCIVYHAANDSIYAVEPTYGGAPRLVRLNSDGDFMSEIQLPPGGFSFSGGGVSSSELVSIGEYLVLLVEPNVYWSYNGSTTQSRMYLIDPRTGQVRLTYQRALPADSDRDGVPDGEDQCPNTPAHTAVDQHGCSIWQRDSDHDGVPDNIDACPNTPAGVEVDGNGCPVVIDGDNDGVADAIDACLNTPPGEPVNQAGCSISQLCPCDQPWPSRGAYFECIDAQTSVFAAAGWITEAEQDRIRNAARDSECGKRNPILFPAQVTSISAEGYRLRVENDGTPGRYILECSENMKTWTAIQTNITAEVKFEMLDASAKSGGPRFYRVRFEAAK